ncbi:MAG: bacitracin ABC transporter ATP-binding protein [Bacteroidetes bacterium GWC2_33_15]|nr:MAG: bacitracin ABC transporter ATP-binding protein [Bacteroidetes bacterium GWA2_33_15]OFX50178.1 MAG: bacitracin ABC transporter ATP-binding protein [Bacteroidetes bacterium GWC2_33_15]OFX65330.1 MAG: bacitracin ABC transporter ATP-binding protein [Bacteroidetes bacterium GWB2_32_14]OFX70557.1 MAG: bacitracin ABC transporter ATP-binding protein [Bacteroidetes bacterium GWD2_33_33]HAN19569.1 bacitracin ABC transporter ATP-binding protein [Bacteroidales bacterium]
MQNVIRTVNLSKSYSDVKAVSEINLNVRKGEIYGFLGLNGAGKTTTIRMLLGLIKPTSGNAFILNEKVHANHNELFKKIGYLVEIPYSYPNLTVRENLEIIRRLRFISGKKPVDDIIDKLQLGAYANRKAKNLSLGNAQRLGLAYALIHNPEILILDEPTNGLDPAGIFEIREMLSNLAKNHGVTVFISSHILGEISRFATRIGIIHQGKMVQEFDADQLDILCKKQLLIGARDLELAGKIILQNGFSNPVAQNGIIHLDDSRAIEHPEQIATILVNAGCPPSLLKVDEENLESYFLRTIEMNGGIK